MRHFSIAISIASSLFFFSALRAQQIPIPGKGSIELGISGGLNTSTVIINDDNNDKPASRAGFNLGLSGDFYFSNRWSFKAKVAYEQKGWNNPSTYEDGNYHLNYVTVPLMANWHFGKTRNWYLNFGPYIGFLTSATATNIGDVKPAFKSTDLGLALGIGVKFPISDNIKIHLELGGEGGFGNILKSSYNTFGNSIRNSSGSLNIGFNFLLK